MQLVSDVIESGNADMPFLGRVRFMRSDGRESAQPNSALEFPAATYAEAEAKADGWLDQFRARIEAATAAAAKPPPLPRPPRGLSPETGAAWARVAKGDVSGLRPRLIKEDTAAAYLGISKTNFRQRWQRSEMPRPITIGTPLLWDLKLLDRYVDALSGLAPTLIGGMKFSKMTRRTRGT
jgi:predicted DNA-binding transcriptional regulator AlpA